MADLDSLAAANALADSEEPRPTRTPPSGRTSCANCGADLHGRYCATCGQLDQPLRMPVHRFLVQSFTEFFGIDGRVWTTLGVLLFKPGKLTEAYLKGRRRRYLRPLRVYLSSTLLFFFLLSVLDPVGRIEGAFERSDFVDSTMTAGAYVGYLDEELADERSDEERQRALVDSLQARLDSIRAAFRADSIAGRFTDADSLDDAQDLVADVLDDYEDEVDELGDMASGLDRRRTEWQREQAAAFPPDSLIRPADLITASEIIVSDGDTGPDIDLGAGEEWIGRGRAYQRLKTARTSQERTRAGIDLTRTAIGKIPIVMFLMLPVFALLLKLIYVRRDWYYAEHLVFGLHTHAFAFVVFSLVTFVAVVGGSAAAGLLITVSAIGIPLYFLIAQKRVYGQGWIKTLLKAWVLGVTYSVVLIGFGLGLTVALAFFAG